jgi:hypothetical protein
MKAPNVAGVMKMRDSFMEAFAFKVTKMALKLGKAFPA